jgi:hypothetical protein
MAWQHPSLTGWPGIAAVSVPIACARRSRLLQAPARMPPRLLSNLSNETRGVAVMVQCTHNLCCTAQKRTYITAVPRVMVNGVNHGSEPRMENTMTKTSKPASAAFQQISDAIDSVNKKIEVPAAARDFVKRNASSTKERAETIHATAAKATEGVEKLATSLVGGYASFTRSLLDISLANVQHTLATVEKLAGVRSLGEAVEVQADFVREGARANIERIRSAADSAKSVVADGAKTVQAEISKIYGFGQQAA